MNIKDKKIALVGGGPGGLTLARLLQQGGCNVTVYERDINKDARVQGANLDLHEESGLAALKKANLLDAFYAHYLPDAGKLRIMDNNGNIHMDDHTEEYGAEHRPEIDRGPLRKILLESLQPNTVVWDSQFVSMEKENDGWQLLFKNDNHYYADIVIGADGANSKIRPYLSDIKPVYSGVTIIEGNIYDAEKNTPNIFKLLKGGKIFAFGNEQSIILSTKGDGSIAFYTGEKVNKNWVKECGINFENLADVKKWFETNFSNWNSIYHELFATSKMTTVPRPLYHYNSDQHWTTQSNLTIIGDAAHRMPPYAGEGVNMAMLDALELSEALLHSENIKSAFENYETRMFERAKEVTAITIQNTVELHKPDGLKYIVDMFDSFN
ncbi:2-polyprenyl-6-methoxyphenol hydroxylase-like FAD-dependent oxidoreductase [Algoriphagus sp. 4150]|uniref:FAD-dependent oxidoreductase n=1 Tax=Algoriphagus sp. 4150 TaxID=2817756 RepID=UPI00285D81C0|nr:NAD(P)/FAD-dependent oxidoreductase [Algoriphagus sp. 4150]MDR7128039.1 2-polyprenyl-6-methoxyphenol hydroxylase-like FAD-dependent oxidoreductase [Algoriphagus sp. 4150]